MQRLSMVKRLEGISGRGKGLSMLVIVQNATIDHISKTGEAVKRWIEQNKAHDDIRITVEWLSKNGCNVYSKGNKDKLCLNIR